jgi:hypothetical protein
MLFQTVTRGENESFFLYWVYIRNTQDNCPFEYMIRYYTKISLTTPIKILANGILDKH